MRWRFLAWALAVWILTAACGREGFPRASSAPAAEVPRVERSGPSPAEQRTFRVHDGPVSLVVDFFPSYPFVGQTVRFDISMRYGSAKQRPGVFSYSLSIDERETEDRAPGCSGPVRSRDASSEGFRDHETRRIKFMRPGPHRFKLSAAPACFRDRRSATMDEEFLVYVMPAGTESLKWSDRDGRMSARVSVTPARPRVGDLVRFVWRLSYDGGAGRRGGGTFAGGYGIEGGPGRRGGPGCGGIDAAEDIGSFSTAESVTWAFDEPGRYRFELSGFPGCARGTGTASVEEEVVVSAR